MFKLLARFGTSSKLTFVVLAFVVTSTTTLNVACQGDEAPKPQPPVIPSVASVQGSPAPNTPPDPATKPVPAATPVPPVPAATPVPPVPQPNPDEAVSAKLNLYVSKCLNRFSERTLASKARYLQWCDAERGPTGSERHIYGLYNIVGDPNQCVQAIQQASIMPPADPELQVMAQRYSDALTKLSPLITQANTYYSRENYRDDNMALGKTLHPQLMSAWTEFAQANKALSDRVDVLQDEIAIRDLARLEQQGKNLRYHVKNTLVLGRRVIRGAMVGEGFEEIDAETFSRDVLAFEAAVDEMGSYSQTHAEETSQIGSFSSYLSESSDYVIDAKELMRRVRDRTPYSGHERRSIGTTSEWMVDGSPGEVVRSFNEFIQAYNRLRN